MGTAWNAPLNKGASKIAALVKGLIKRIGKLFGK